MINSSSGGGRMPVYRCIIVSVFTGIDRVCVLIVKCTLLLMLTGCVSGNISVAPLGRVVVLTSQVVSVVCCVCDVCDACDVCCVCCVACEYRRAE